MNIDEYLNNLQNDLDDQLSRFGVTGQPQGNMFSSSENEEKKFALSVATKSQQMQYSVLSVDSVFKKRVLMKS